MLLIKKENTATHSLWNNKKLKHKTLKLSQPHVINNKKK